MSVNIHVNVLEIKSAAKARQEMEKIGCDPVGVGIMGEKTAFKVMKITRIRSKAANLLKQTFLGKGGDVAVSRHAADLSEEYTDAIIAATHKQYRQALPQLKMQPWGLSAVADTIEKLLRSDGNLPRRTYRWKDRTLTLDEKNSLVMGILNVTPDSFSDGGKYDKPEEAVERVKEMQRSGADIIDIGAESTRPYPGAEKITAEMEMDRLLPVLEKILPHCHVPVSVDTYKAKVAEAALKCGAHMINDVWGLQGDERMAMIAAEYGSPIVVMHNKENREYPDGVMRHIQHFLQKSIAIGIEKGIKCENIIIDPGIGFAKTAEHNLEIMSRLEELQSFGCPVLLGASRKNFIGHVLNLPVEERLEGTIAVAALGKTKGVQIHRVHNVKEVKRALKMMDAMMGV